MTTLGDLINEVHLNLLGYVIDQESLTTILTAMADDDSTIQVDDASQISPGLIEVDEELMWCSRVDADNGVVYVSIRGFYGSTAAAHSVGAIVRNEPKFPRFSIMRAINDTIRSMYPDVFAVDSTTLTSSLATATYELPADVELVLEVSYDAEDGTEYWDNVRRFDVNMHANTTAFATGKSITIHEAMETGHTVNVTYRKVPTVLAATSDQLTDSGLQESAKEAIVYGACSRLVGYTEVGRTNDDAAEARFIDGSPAGQALNAARYFYQLHLQARAEETRRLLDRYPPRIHFNR